MIYLKSFCFNPFQQNTYVLYDNLNNAVIIDPGNCNAFENKTVSDFISEKNLKLNRLLFTHAHIDHILGNNYIFETYGLLPELNKEELFFIENAQRSAAMYGVSFEPGPAPNVFINEQTIIDLGNYQFTCMHTPGHSPGSMSFYCKQANVLVSGDVLFYKSIGRTDLPLGNHEDLINSIKQKLFILPNNTKVYSGHGQPTTIGFEKDNNPYLN
jgi:hydroxyacylglutathione hydrolase